MNRVWSYQKGKKRKVFKEDKREVSNFSSRMRSWKDPKTMNIWKITTMALGA
jgi:hypothetical protein